MSPGTAVCNDALSIRDLLKTHGYRTEVFAEYINPCFKNEVKYFRDLKPSSKDIVLYHYCIGTKEIDNYVNLSGKKTMIYHNITPHGFFEGYSEELVGSLRKARKDLQKLLPITDRAIADSEYSRKELLEAGFKKTAVLPIIVDFEKYAKVPQRRMFEDDLTNFLFVGRLAPNKKIENVIKVFYYYQKCINPKSRLVILGSYREIELRKYYYLLRGLTEKLGLSNVVFTNDVKFEEMVNYYREADLFITMSEHEGFCVPLLESMYFGVPIVAHNATAIPDTLGSAGVLVNQKKYLEIAKIAGQIIENETLRSKIVEGQYKRLKDFSKEKLENQFLAYISEMRN